MPACRLPDNPNLEQLKNHAKTLQQFVRAGVPQAIELVRDRSDAVMLMAELGFDVSAASPYPHQQTALHGAAYNGNVAMVGFLVQHGADRNGEDLTFTRPRSGGQITTTKSTRSST